MIHQPELTDAEWGMVLQLLETERRNLPPEIRRTDVPTVHDDLLVRLNLIDGLIERIHRSMTVTV